VSPPQPDSESDTEEEEEEEEPEEEEDEEEEVKEEEYDDEDSEEEEEQAKRKEERGPETEAAEGTSDNCDKKPEEGEVEALTSEVESFFCLQNIFYIELNCFRKGVQIRSQLDRKSIISDWTVAGFGSDLKELQPDTKQHAFFLRP
jgi:hypothetical protein